MEVPSIRTARLTLTVLSESDLDVLDAVARGGGVSEWWGEAGEPGELREELRNDGSAFAIALGGACSGWLGFEEEPSPGYRHASLDIFLAPSVQDRGLGSEALRAAVAWLIEARQHRRFTIDPALANTRAIRAYEAVGFRAVGVMRGYERGGDGNWHDNLLMDLLATELTAQRG